IGLWPDARPAARAEERPCAVQPQSCRQFGAAHGRPATRAEHVGGYDSWREPALAHFNALEVAANETVQARSGGGEAEREPPRVQVAPLVRVEHAAQPRLRPRADERALHVLRAPARVREEVRDRRAAFIGDDLP